MNKVEVFFLILATCIMAVAMGMVVHIYENSKSEKEIIRDAEIFNSLRQNDEAISTTASEAKVSPNAIIVMETYYKKCGHSVISKQEVSKDDINKTEEQIKAKYNQYYLRKFSPDKIELYKEVDKLCNNHYVVKENNGMIAVFSKNDDGTETLKNETDVSTKYLPKEDVELLENGIEANSNEELEQILSDYEQVTEKIVSNFAKKYPEYPFEMQQKFCKKVREQQTGISKTRIIFLNEKILYKNEKNT